MKTEVLQPGDNTALNAIRLYCGPQTVNTSISSTQGPWGRWGNVFTCNGFFIGATFRSQKPQGDYDDTGGNNLEMWYKNMKKKLAYNNSFDILKLLSWKLSNSFNFIHTVDLNNTFVFAK